jgi:hypothetical protein
MAAKKSKKKVTITIDLETLQKLLAAVDQLGEPDGIEFWVDDPDLARKLKKRPKKRR